MLVYIIAIAIAVLFAGLYMSARAINTNNLASAILKRSAPIFLVGSFLALFLLSGFRVDVGIDYPSYVQWFYDIYNYDFSYFEPGFRAIIGIIQIFSLDPQWLFIVSSFLTIGIIYISIKKYSFNPALSVFLFSTMGFLSHSLNLTRQFIAIAIILYAFNYLVNQKFWKYAAAVGVAALFHQTALIMLPVYFLLRMKLKPAHYLVILIVSAIISLFQKTIINTLVVTFYPQYYNKAFIGDTIISSYYIILCLCLMVSVVYLLTKKKISVLKDSDRVIINTIFLVTLSHIFFTWVPLSNRVSLYIDISLIIIIPNLLAHIESKTRRSILIFIITLYFLWAGYMSLQTNANGVLPYKSSLFSYITPNSSILVGRVSA